MFRRMRLFLIGPLILMLQVASGAAELQTPLTCNITQQLDGSVFYRLSRPPSSSDCSRGWETENRTVIAVNSKFDAKLVLNLTAEGIVMKSCHEHLRYTEDCKVFDEALCRVNCSSLLSLNLNRPIVNSTTTCFFPHWCPDPEIFWSCFTIVGVVVVAVVVRLFLWKRISKLMRGSSYSPANDQIKDGGMEMVHRDDIV